MGQHMPKKAQHERNYTPIPDLLRHLREEAGLTQRDLASLLQRPQSWVYNSETANRRVDLAEFVAWCEACGISARKGLDRYLSQVARIKKAA
jgi:transcriptional regulator with XRE-family HTH domain